MVRTATTSTSGVPVFLSPSPAHNIADSCTMLCPIRYALDAFDVNQHVCSLARYTPPSLAATDGTTTIEEFIAFFFEMRSGHKSTNPVRVQIARLTSCWWSPRTKTVKSILISHLQLTSSLVVSFPGMYSDLNASTDKTDTNFVSGIFSSVQDEVQPVFDVVSNMNVQVLQFMSCAVGPRQVQRLTFNVGLILCLIGLPWCIALILHLLARINTSIKQLAGATSNFATRLSVSVHCHLSYRPASLSLPNQAN